MTTFFMFGVNEKIKNNKLLQIDKLINWSRCMNHLRKIHKQDESLLGGQTPYDRLKMFKAILLQNWYSLSDEELVEALSVRVDFMAFSGFELADELPDSSTFCRFRNKLISRNIHERLFREINNQIEKLGLKVKKAECAIVDATIIESCNRPKKQVLIEVDREENGIKIEESESKDPDARWLKKGNKCYFGYRGYARTDEDGYYDKVHAKPANLSETKEFPEAIKGSTAKCAMGDKGFASKANRDAAIANNQAPRIMYKAQKNKPITKREQLANTLISGKRFVVERAFGTLKRQFKFTKASYATTVKVQFQFTMKAICANLLKAINRAISPDFVPYCT